MLFKSNYSFIVWKNLKTIYQRARFCKIFKWEENLEHFLLRFSSFTELIFYYGLQHQPSTGNQETFKISPWKLDLRNMLREDSQQQQNRI